MLVGALEANRWAGLVFAAGPDDGIGVRLAFVDPRGRRRDRDDWYWMVSRAGPHAPEGSHVFSLGVFASRSRRPRSSLDFPAQVKIAITSLRSYSTVRSDTGFPLGPTPPALRARMNRSQSR